MAVQAPTYEGTEAGTIMGIPKAATPGAIATSPTPTGPRDAYGNPINSPNPNPQGTGSAPSTPTSPSSLPPLPSVDSAPGVEAARALAQPSAAPDLATLQEQERTSVQAEIDGINADLASQEGDIDKTEQENSRRAAYAAFLTGIAGAPDAESARATVKSAADKQRTDAREAATAKINALLSHANDLASQKYDADLKTSKDEANTYLSNLGSKAKDILSGLAATLAPYGKTLDDFKKIDPTSYNNLKSMSGLSDYELEALYASSVPDQYKPSTKETTIVLPNGNAGIVRSTFNPASGAHTSTQYDTGISYPQYNAANLVKGQNGELLMPNPKDNGATFIRVTPQTLGDWKQVGTDDYGNPAYGFVNPETGKITYGNAGSPSPTTSTAPKSATTDDQYADFLSDKTPQQQQAFSALPTQDKANVSALINGDVLLSDIAKGGVKGTLQAQRLIGLAKQVDPSFSENVNKSRYNFLKNWNDPQQKSFQNRTTINTALGHIAELQGAVAGLDNTTINKYNSFKNFISSETGNPDVPDFNTILTALASEYAGLYKGSSPTDPEIDAWKNSFESNYSPKTLNQLITRVTNLASDRMNSLTNEYKSSMGKFPTDPIVQQDSLDKLKAAGVDTSKLEAVMQKSQPQIDPTKQAVGSTFQFNGHTVRKTGDDEYELVDATSTAQ